VKGVLRASAAVRLEALRVRAAEPDAAMTARYEAELHDAITKGSLRDGLQVVAYRSGRQPDRVLPSPQRIEAVLENLRSLIAQHAAPPAQESA
jgi:hypothetical protein